MDIRTLEYKMRDVNGVDIAKNVCLWAPKGKEPVTIQLIGKNTRFEFGSYQEACDFTLPDGRKVKNLIDRLTDEDFRMKLSRSAGEFIAQNDQPGYFTSRFAE